MAAFLDGCKFWAASNGTADFVVASVFQGGLTPAQAGAVNGKPYKYYAVSANKLEFEFGEGIYVSGTTTLPRTTILFSSNGGAKVNFTLQPIVSIVALKEDLISIEEDNAFTETQKAQARENIYAAPFDAIAYNGMQLNGAMDVSQEKAQLGTSTSGSYILDGWVLGKVGTMSVTAQQYNAATLAGFPNILNIAVSTAQGSLGAGDAVHVYQPLEGYRIARLAFGNASASPITLAFWTAHNRTGTYSGSIRNNIPNRNYSFTYTQNVSDVWEYKTVTIPGDVTGTWLGTTSIGMYLTLAMALGSNAMTTPGVWSATSFQGATGQVNAVASTSDVFRLTGVKVLPGIEFPSAARSPLIMRPFNQELETAMRYYRKSFDYATVPAQNTGVLIGSAVVVPPTAIAGSGSIKIMFGGVMRAVATIVTYNTNAADANWWDTNAGASRLVAVGDQSQSGFRCVVNAASTAGGQHFIHWTADSRL